MNFAKWHYFSFLVQDQTVLLCSLGTLLFCCLDLICLTEIEFLYFWPKSEDEVREYLLPRKKIWQNLIFKILSYIYQKTAPFSNRVPHSAITENQIYSTRSSRSSITYPPEISMIQILSHHLIITTFQNT